MDYSKVFADLGSYSKLVDKMDLDKIMGLLDTMNSVQSAVASAQAATKPLAKIDFANVFWTSELAAAMAKIDFAALHDLDLTKVFDNETVVSEGARVAEVILRSDELVDTVAAAEVTEVGRVEPAVEAAPAAGGMPTDVLRAADPLGLMIQHRELTNTELAILQLIATAVGAIALTSHHQTAEVSAAASLIAFFVLRAAMSRTNAPWT
jgi:hypothetical protein